MKRRRFVAGALGAATLGALGGGAWLAGSPATPAGIGDLDAARRFIDAALAGGARTRSGWPLAQLFEHAAQSIEYSIDGYPSMKPAWFRASVGRAAYRAFARAGTMHHDLDEAIPGAPALVETDPARGAARLRAAIDRFDAHHGGFAPHFAYGALDRDGYARAHLLHLADHARRIVRG